MNNPTQLEEYLIGKSRALCSRMKQDHQLGVAAATILGGMNTQVSNDHANASKVISLSNCVTSNIFASFPGSVDHRSFVQSSGNYGVVPHYDYFAQTVPGLRELTYEKLFLKHSASFENSNVSWIKLFNFFNQTRLPTLSGQERTTFRLAFLVRLLERSEGEDTTFLKAKVKIDSQPLQLAFEKRDKNIKSVYNASSVSICRCNKVVLGNVANKFSCIREDCLLKKYMVIA